MFLKAAAFLAPALLLDPPPPENLYLTEEVATPPSLMLHSRDQYRVPLIIPELQRQGYQAITYREYYETLLQRSKNLIPYPILITLDDMSVTYLNPAFHRIISAFREARIKFTLGIVTRYDRRYASQEIWNLYRELSREGCELAIHTESHADLTSVSRTELNYQIEEPYTEIVEKTGVAPVTLILPYGFIIDRETGEYDQRIFDVCRRLSIAWIVGIGEGRRFTGSPPYYVGRIPPEDTGIETVVALKNRFPE